MIDSVKLQELVDAEAKEMADRLEIKLTVTLTGEATVIGDQLWYLATDSIEDSRYPDELSVWQFGVVDGAVAVTNQTSLENAQDLYED
ncbi:hypothetical protein SEA_DANIELLEIGNACE_62 [Arthrobacter phage DanielleIgnace]|nr:hypothetical protein SEA_DANIELLEIGNACE_62 [Arthrobacter phage DanielleIgnace]